MTISSIETKGNWFWKDGERVINEGNYNSRSSKTNKSQFLIKGVTYCPRAYKHQAIFQDSRIDPLSEAWLPQLKRDIPLFQQLGINTISVEHLDPTESPEQALQLLHDAGIYVLLELFGNLNPKENGLHHTIDDLQHLYSPVKIRKNLATVQQTAHFSNLLGYSISQSTVCNSTSTKLAALHRAAVRDTKLFIRKLGVSRHIPVGASMSANQQFRLQALQYMTAGAPEERADFTSFGVYDWVGPSSFQISGWKNMVEAFGRFPVPMFWGDYGTAYPGRKRVLDEVDCLFSPDMTGVVSGGLLHTYGHTDYKKSAEEKEDDSDDDDDEDRDEDEGGYDLVKIEDDGSRVPKRDFGIYQQKLGEVASKPPADVVGNHEMKDYENWRGQFEANNPRYWTAEPGDVPDFPLDWNQVLG